MKRDPVDNSAMATEAPSTLADRLRLGLFSLRTSRAAKKGTHQHLYSAPTRHSI